ncbi:MerR family transcriptional regulator [Mumia zhuanghuii]|uniref:MerR family transcriptional regulator n=1 Tax=Mumia zhuanghuii TaxID=2585211 RepID=UPI001E312D1A|nr:MerR family transcriptional regulator [Mumia zhuanghuii]
MRSNELAQLAGVTVRALRHYHQVGVLPEPPRSPNGYRAYDVHDLVRVLRIKRLTSLGLALQDLPSLLEQPDDAESVLDDLDHELAAEIARLSAQRAVVAQLRQDGVPPDLPPELGRHATLFAAAGSSAALARVDREQAILLAHLAGEDGMAEVVRFYELLAAPEVVAASASLYATFDALGTHSSTKDVERVADDVVAAAGPVLQAFAASGTTLDLGGLEAMLLSHTRDLLNAAQQQALTLIEERLTALMET